MSDTATEVDVLLEENAEDTMRGQYLTLNLGNQQFAISIEYVVDIINVQPITRVPNCPRFVIGITNLRGKAVPVVDLRLRFGKEFREYTNRTCIIVLEERGATVGLVVDSVAATIKLDDAHISPPPMFNQDLEAKFIKGVGRGVGGIILILDCKTVLDDNLADSMELMAEGNL